MRRALLTGLILVIITMPAAAEIQVNVRTSGAQANAAVALDSGGDSVIVWSSYYTTSGRSNDILARRLDAYGTFRSEFLVNTAREGNQTEPAVAMDGQGGFAVAWHGPGLEEEDIFLRLFDANDLPTTEELLVNLRTPGRQLYPCVAAGGAGTLVVGWESRETTPDGDQTFVYSQLFDPNGSGLGAETRVDTDIYDCRYPEVAMDAAGNFAVVWMRDRSNHPIMARLFDPNGVARTDPFQVNTARVASVTRPAIAMNTAGCFVITWDGDPNRASADDIHARLYDPNGTPLSEPFGVNTMREGAQQWPQVAINDANEFVIVWEHDTGDPDAATEIFARRFGLDGEPLTEQSQLNAHTPGKQREPDIAMTEEGSFVAIWESDDQDGSGYGIFAHVEPPAPSVESENPGTSN